MKDIQWRPLLIVLVIVGLLMPQFLKWTLDKEQAIKGAQMKLAQAKDLIEHRDDYIIWQKELEVKGEDLWGSQEIGAFLGEIESISKTAGVPIRSIKPYNFKEAVEKDSIGVEVNVDGEMTSIGRFLYEALKLPGFVQVEKLRLSESNRAGASLSAEILISRKTRFSQ